MKKITLIVAVLVSCFELVAQNDLVIGNNYQLNIQRKNSHADAFILHNAEYSSGYDVLKWKTTHGTFGSRGIRFSYHGTRGIYFYADDVATIAGNTFTPTTRMFIGNKGNVGIGTTSPEARFHVSTQTVGIKSQNATSIIEAKDAHLDLISSSADTWGSSINLIEGNGSSNTDVWSMTRQTTNGSGNSSLRFNFGTSNHHINTNVATFNANGNVGIGHSDATARLHVYKNATTGNWGSNTMSNAGVRIQDSGASLYIDGNTLYTDAVMNIGTINNNPLSLGTNNAERLRINTNGSVGIGTSSTGSHKLAVEGSIGAREIIIEANSWSDFVFENDYELRTLEEVENHITEKGHLPEIPSEAEVMKNGINLGEMDAKLLQKIEELTLYMIDMNKEVKQLKSENQALKEEIATLKRN